MTFPRSVASLVLVATLLGGCTGLVQDRAAWREAEAEAIYPPGGRFVQVAGKRVHAVTGGAGRDLVLIHGAGGNTRDFTFHLADRLARDYRVTVFDRPGFGYTDSLGAAGNSPAAQARMLQDAARQLGVRKPIILGHSYGGAVAMAWALTEPDYVDGLVIVSGATMPLPGELEPWYRFSTSDFGVSLLAPWMSAFANKPMIDWTIGLVYSPDTPPPGYNDYLGARLSLRRASLKDNAGQIAHLKPALEAQARHYPKLKIPVEIVHGTHDRTVPFTVHAVPLANVLPNAQLTLIEGAGHMLHHSREDEVAAAINRVARR